MRTDSSKGQNFPLVFWFHIHVTNFEIQSRDCLYNS